MVVITAASPDVAEAVDRVAAALSCYWNDEELGIDEQFERLCEAGVEWLGFCTDDAAWQYAAVVIHDADPYCYEAPTDAHYCAGSCREAGCHRGCDCIAKAMVEIC